MELLKKERDFKILKGDWFLLCDGEHPQLRNGQDSFKQLPHFLYSFESKFKKYIPGSNNGQSILSTKHIH